MNWAIYAFIIMHSQKVFKKGRLAWIAFRGAGLYVNAGSECGVWQKCGRRINAMRMRAFRSSTEGVYVPYISLRGYDSRNNVKKLHSSRKYNKHRKFL